jgi:tetratricopeptide (TPR) repeat protein
MAEQAMKDKDFAKARRLFGEAELNDPEGKLGRKGLEDLKTRAKNAYGKGLVHQNRKKIKEAIAAFKEALKYAEPGTYHYDDSRKQLGTLEQ